MSVVSTSQYIAVGDAVSPGRCAILNAGRLMLLNWTIALPAALRSPRLFAAIGVGAAAVASVLWYRFNRDEPDPGELERERRDYLAAAGRIVDGSITGTRWADDAPGEATPNTLIYRYRIAGVTYECAQDVRPLTDLVRNVRMDLPVQVRFDPRNPGDSIIVAESWSGLRIDPAHATTPADAEIGV